MLRDPRRRDDAAPAGASRRRGRSRSRRSGPTTPLRPLTEKGRKVHAKVTRALREAGLVPELVLTSPWLRAAQTAEVMTQGARPRGGGPVPAARRRSGPARAGRRSWAIERGKRSWRWWVTRPGSRSWPRCCSPGPPKGVAMDFPKSGVLAVEADERLGGSGDAAVFPEAEDGVTTPFSRPSARRSPDWTNAPGSPSSWG